MFYVQGNINDVLLLIISFFFLYKKIIFHIFFLLKTTRGDKRRKKYTKDFHAIKRNIFSFCFGFLLGACLRNRLRWVWGFPPWWSVKYQTNNPLFGFRMFLFIRLKYFSSFVFAFFSVFSYTRLMKAWAKVRSFMKLR